MQERLARLVPIPDSCRVLGGIGRTKLYELINAGEIDKVHIGTRAFITRDSLEHFLARITGKPGTDKMADGAEAPAGAVVPGDDH